MKRTTSQSTASFKSMTFYQVYHCAVAIHPDFYLEPSTGKKQKQISKMVVLLKIGSILKKSPCFDFLASLLFFLFSLNWDFFVLGRKEAGQHIGAAAAAQKRCRRFLIFSVNKKRKSLFGPIHLFPSKTQQNIE